VRVKFLGLFSSSHGEVLISQGYAPNLKISQGFHLTILKPTIENILSTKYKKHIFGSSMVTAVDAVLVLCVSPARNNTKCRHSTQKCAHVMNILIMVLKSSIVRHLYKFLLATLIGIGYNGRAWEVYHVPEQKPKFAILAIRI